MNKYINSWTVTEGGLHWLGIDLHWLGASSTSLLASLSTRRKTDERRRFRKELTLAAASQWATMGGLDLRGIVVEAAEIDLPNNVSTSWRNFQHWRVCLRKKASRDICCIGKWFCVSQVGWEGFTHTWGCPWRGGRWCSWPSGGRPSASSCCPAPGEASSGSIHTLGQGWEGEEEDGWEQGWVGEWVLGWELGGADVHHEHHWHLHVRHLSQGSPSLDQRRWPPWGPRPCRRPRCGSRGRKRRARAGCASAAETPAGQEPGRRGLWRETLMLSCWRFGRNWLTGPTAAFL